MSRTTIDFGIDLGTTNSSIAVLNGTTPEVIQSQEPGQFGSVVTPSAIWFDKRGRQQVGLKARDNYFGYAEWDRAGHLVQLGEESGALEFKLRMGQRWEKPFRFVNRNLAPEEMSAEVLKTLRRDVQTAKGEDIAASIITVPAAFELPQCEATRRAGELAGFTLCPLLQEPVAAALAYGFQSAANKVFWLVYDFGGGTFDAAVMQVRDRVIQVVNHAGDNYLGGKNIDWDIVEKLVVPALAREHRLDARLLTRSSQDKIIRLLLNKLKYRAEEAKINVSTTRRPAVIVVERLRVPDSDNECDFEYELTPAALQQIIEPWVVQTVNLCKKALQEKGLSGRDIEKTILVGGSSLFPWLQERVGSELETRLDFSVNPITVVALGAAVFAGTQHLTVDHGPVPAGRYRVEGLKDFDPIGSDTDPLLICRITPPTGASAEGLTVEIVEKRSEWRSGIIRVSSNGTFMTEVHAEKGRKCEFQIILADARGTRLSCSPDSFAYTVGMVITSPPLTHNLGVAMANNKPKWFFRKGEALPARSAPVVFHTTCALHKSQPDSDANVIRIPIIEGTNEQRADRNHQIGKLEIMAHDGRVRRDVPVGSAVEVSIAVDESRTKTVKVFVPILDEEFDDVVWLGYENRPPNDLQTELRAEIHRLNELQRRAESLNDHKVLAAIAAVENEQVVDQVTRKVAAAQGDAEACGEADKKLLDLRAAVDSVEDALEWPDLVREARRHLESTREVVEANGEPEEKERLATLAADVEQAIGDERIELLRHRTEDLRDLGYRVLVRKPDIWVAWLQDLAERKDGMTDQAAADRLLAQGHRAIQSEPCDFEALKAAVRQLIGLLRPDEREAAQAAGLYRGTIMTL